MEPLVALVAILVIAAVAARAWWRSSHAPSSAPAVTDDSELPHWPASGGFDIHAMGNLADADAIVTLASAADGGTGPMYATATLRLEPVAGGGKRAVSVLIDHRHAAYLESADAADYSARLDELGLRQAHTTCDAVVRTLGADRGRPPQILVQLDLDLASRPTMDHAGLHNWPAGASPTTRQKAHGASI